MAIPKVTPIESACGTAPPLIMKCASLAVAPSGAIAIEYDAFVAV